MKTPQIAQAAHTHIARVVHVTHVVRNEDGEEFEVEDFGAPENRPVLVHPGSPGSRRLYRPDAEAAVRDHGVRLLSFDRPGYRGRPRRAGRRMADVVGDVRCVAGHLGIDRMGVWGFSGGATYALACAALLPDLVAGAVVFGSFAPYGAEGLDLCGDWPQEYRHEVELFFTDRETARENWRRDAERFHAACSDPDGWMARWGEAAGTDAAHSRELAEYLAAVTDDGLAGGAPDGDDGYWDDWAAILTPWGFDPSAVTVPVQLWQGGRDRNVPVTNGRWLAARIPRVDAHIHEDEDHSTIEENNRSAAYAWLSALI